jgi:hypothetical protein
MSLIVSYYGQFEGFPMFIIEIVLCLWREHVCQYVYILFVIPHHGGQVIAHCSVCVTLLEPLLLASVFCGLTAPHQFIVLVHESNNCGDELSTYNLCPTFSVVAGSPVTAASVAVIEGVACSLSFPECSHIVHRPISLTVTQLIIFCQTVCVSFACVAWKWLYSWRTIISSAKCSVLL